MSMHWLTRDEGATDRFQHRQAAAAVAKAREVNAEVLKQQKSPGGAGAKAKKLG
jgi:hypothetical protein